MNWYLAKLVYRVICIGGNHAPQFDQQFRIIRAEDDLHAFHKARLIGEGDCINEPGEINPVAEWKFIDVTELHPLTHLSDGVEVFSKITEEEHADMYIRTVQKKGVQLLQQCLNQFTCLNSVALGS